ncbi:MAG TPA: hypothetical protein VFV63_20305 [Ilumatobacteraceae bacterium]|nr:hypothetical protein [Ilumatobacteraceae bacterium]
MAHAVEFADVRRRVEEFGDRATLVTITESSVPHVVSTVVEVVDDRLRTRVGQRTAANLVAHPALSLVWHPADGGEYQLIVDGIAEPTAANQSVDGVTTVSIVVTGGILHRLAELPGDAPSCIALGE